ncbi:hypothetical protein [Paraburkholderia dilworthii]|uniref:hypothetical protein n=1 Tax=Paraburkholderia dilworthii TaxID=948106 RepID=UPI001FCC1765|nr:hypothetical protein [Paraburkholderia dilworthii]
MLRTIDLNVAFKGDDKTGPATSPASSGDVGTQQRHAANPRPARLRGPSRPERSRRRRIARAATGAAASFR